MIEIRIVPSSREELARVVELLKSFGGTLAEKPAAVELAAAPAQADTWIQASIERAAQHQGAARGAAAGAASIERAAQHQGAARGAAAGAASIERAAQHYAAQVVGAEQAAAAPAPAPAPAPAEPPAPPPAPEVTLEQVRAELAALAAAGKKAEVRDLLTQVGAERLTEVSPKLYAFLLEKAQALR